LLAGIIFFLAACSSPEKKSADGPKETPAETAADTGNPITITKAPASPAYEDAVLTLEKPYPSKQPNADSIEFKFVVSNYELGAQTADAAERGIANSGKGQHIHLIVNNGPYSAHYTDNFKKPMEPGSYTILAFLSRSYHESVKNTNAFIVEQITVGDVKTPEVDFEAAHMFYSRPKGTYKGADTKKLMLDFYLLNTTLAPDGNKVKATINGKEFIIDEWAPFYIENAPLGELTVSLELIDKDGNYIAGPFNKVTRKVTLAE
ncbi:MAG: hypothetical protein AAFO69_20260, partial [Bacteroidota bacterium]